MEAVAIRYIQIWVCRSLVISLPTQWRATRGHKRSCRWPGTHRISLYVGKHPVKNSIERQLWLGVSNQGFSYIFGPGHPQISLSVHQLAIFLISMHVRGLLLFPHPLHSRLSILVDLLNVPCDIDDRGRLTAPPHHVSAHYWAQIKRDYVRRDEIPVPATSLGIKLINMCWDVKC